MRMKFAAAGLLCALMTGCGGSGGGSSSSGDNENTGAPTPDAPNQPSALSAEGRWVGKINDHVQAVIHVLENGEVWGTYASGAAEDRNLFGQLSTEGSSFKGTLTDTSLHNGSSVSTEFTGQIAAEDRLDFKLPQKNGFSLVYDAQYEQAADAGALQGTHQGNSFHVANRKSTGEDGTTVIHRGTSHPAHLTVSASGEAVFSYSPNCSVTGTLLPRPSGKNIFDAVLTYQGDLCLQDHGTAVNGIAVLENDTGTLRVQTLNEDKTIGFSYVAVTRR